MPRLLAFLVLASALPAAPRDPVAYVNPLIGTMKSKIGYGGTMPFVSPPFAMTNWTPQTRQRTARKGGRPMRSPR
jgi:putative alpha-1,2-mannosidase